MRFILYFEGLCIDLHGYYPHSTDCSKFYQCDNGVAYEHSCPDETWFNPQINVCDHKSTVIKLQICESTAAELDTILPEQDAVEEIGRAHV